MPAPMSKTSAADLPLPLPPPPGKTPSPRPAAQPSNRQESHRIYLQLFASRAGRGPAFHRHDSHEIHPPKYPMTTPGVPYPFSSSSSSESSASYSFSSSLSSAPNSFHGNGGNRGTAASSAQSFVKSHHPPPGHAPSSHSGSHARNHDRKPTFAGYPPTATTSAAIRLTDRARARDVTALLRGKFGLPPLPDRRHSRGSDGGRGGDESRDGDEVDALVLVGTMERPPRGYLRFEHEEFLEERSRLDAFRKFRAHALRKQLIAEQLRGQSQPQREQQQLQQRRGRADSARGAVCNDPSLTETIRASNLQRQSLPISNSAATIRASGAQGPLDQSSSSLAPPGVWSGGSVGFEAGISGGSGSDAPFNKSGDESSPVVRGRGNSGSGSGSGSGIGLDLSSSRGSSVFGGSGSRSASSWGAMVGATIDDTPDFTHETASSPEAADKSNISTWSSRTKLTTLLSELSDSEHDASATPQKDRPAACAAASAAASASATDTSNVLFTIHVPEEPQARQTTVTDESRTSPNQRSARPIPLGYDYDSEPIHIVRTVLPEEHPLHVRDEMFTRLVELRSKAEMEMGLRLDNDDNGYDEDDSKPTTSRHPPVTQPTFRWYFQPCCALGGCGSTARSPKIQNIPAYVDLEGYCTGTDEEMEDEDENESDDDDHASKSGISSKEMAAMMSPRMRQLAKERKRISLLRDLPDPAFLVSGYLLKQSSKDPNVWRRFFCVLSADRMWMIGRMKPLDSKSERILGNGDSIEEFLSSLRVGRHSCIKLHRSLLLMGGSGDDHDPNLTSASNCNNPIVSPLNRRLPNAFRIWTAKGGCYTFRAYTLSSFRVWTRSLMEKITSKHGDDLMELSDLIAEEENLARSRRMEEIAVTPFVEKIVNLTGALGALNSTKGIVMHVTRFGMSVSEYRELCRHTNEAIRPNHGTVVNVRTKVGSTLRPNATQQISGGNIGFMNTPFAAIQLSKDDERIGMISAVWEEARILASRSAQLLHALAALQQGITMQNHSYNRLASNPDVAISDLINSLVKEQKEVQSILGQRWNNFSSVPRTYHHSKDEFSGTGGTEITTERRNTLDLPPAHLFDSIVDKFQYVSALTSV